MTTKMNAIVSSFVLALLMLSCADMTCFAANTNDCTALSWTANGIVITDPGFYCLTADIHTGSGFNGNAITIQSPNVILDLGSHTISNLGAGSTTKAVGISAQGQLHIVVRNGTLEGFYRAIYFNQNSDQLIENIRSDSATYEAIYVNVSGAVVRHNYIVNEGGLPTATAAISVAGNGFRLLDNDIVDLQTGGSASYAINVSSGEGVVVEGNRISSEPLSAGIDYGIIAAANATDILVENNRILGMTNGVAILGTGKYRDNLTAGVTTPYSGGTNAGNNQ